MKERNTAGLISIDVLVLVLMSGVSKHVFI